MSAFQDSVKVLRSLGAGEPRLALVLGSGFAAALEGWPVRRRISYDAIPHMPRCQVQGHAAELLCIALDDAGSEAWVFSGRLHAYEGHAPADVVRPVDLAAAAGARLLMLTCAAGGIRPGLDAGDMVLISDHLNLTGLLPPLAGEQFLDLSQVYDVGSAAAVRAAAAAAGCNLPQGILAALRGPVYETPAEVRMLATLGADMVSMSTVPEAIRARALGLPVVGLACIANRAAGLSPATLEHREVLAQVNRSAAAAGPWLLEALRSLAVPPSA